MIQVQIDGSGFIVTGEKSDIPVLQLIYELARQAGRRTHPPIDLTNLGQVWASPHWDERWGVGIYRPK